MDPQAAQTNTPQPTKSRGLLVPLLIILVIAAAGVVGYFAYKSLQPKTPQEKIVTGLSRDSITIGIAREAFQVFPNSQSETSSAAFDSQIFDGLGKIINGKIEPDLATSWTNPDKNTWRFHLRKGVKFSNGNPFTASDIKFSIDTAIKENWPDAFNLSTVESAIVIDDFTVDIKTASPDPVLFNRLAYIAIVSSKQFENIGSATAVGTGPYKFVKGDDKEVVLEANPDYFLGSPKVKKVVYKFFPDGTDADLLQSLHKGEIDLAWQVSDPTLAHSVEKEFQVKVLPDPFITLLWLDTTREKSPYVDKSPNPLKNKLVREAIYTAIDPNKVIKAASRSGEPASQLVTNSIFGFNPAIKRPQLNIEKAKDLLKQAGVPDGFNMTLDIYQRIEQEGKALAEALAKINIKVTVNVLSDDDFFPKILDKQEYPNFIVDYGAETFDAGEIFTDVLHTPTGNFGGNNLTNYSNLEVDKLADEIAITLDQTARKKILQSAMVTAMKDLPLIPLYARDTFYIFRNDYDWTPTAFGNIYPNEISGRQVVKE